MAFTTASALRVLSLLLAGTVLSHPAWAQQPAPAAAAPDPAFEAAKSAFEALPEADRRAIQDALVWTGDYKGNVDGSFGRGTRDAIVAYARRGKLPTDGTLDQKAKAALVAAADKARNAQAFRKVVDTRSGIAIGLPTKAMSRKTDTKTGTTWSTTDGAAAIDTFQNAEADSDLPRLFEILRGDAPGRKVTYRVLRPDFLVVTGEEGERVFYTRAARGMANGVATVRGYTLSYARRLRPTYDVLSIAIANAFEPFPSAASDVSRHGGTSAVGFGRAACGQRHRHRPRPLSHGLERRLRRSEDRGARGDHHAARCGNRPRFGRSAWRGNRGRCANGLHAQCGGQPRGSVRRAARRSRCRDHRGDR